MRHNISMWGKYSENPAILLVCPLARFVVSRFVSDMRAESLLQIILLRWITLFGFPRLVLCDQGTPFRGAMWASFLYNHGVMMSGIPKEPTNQIGACEKQNHLLKTSYQTIRRSLPLEWANESVMALACVAHNSRPLSFGNCSPFYLTTGKSGALAWARMDSIHDENFYLKTTALFWCECAL